VEEWIAGLLGRTVVYMQDHDGEVNKAWAWSTPYGLQCWRLWPLRKVTLLTDGSVQGACYVDSWKPARLDRLAGGERGK
jgi:hypothetical protein